MNDKGNYKALLPIAVFVLLYIGLGIYFEYFSNVYIDGTKVSFGNVPVVIIFLVALMVACLQNRKLIFAEKTKIMARGLAEPNLLTMILIFLCAGAFVGIVGRQGAESVAYFTLSFIPAEFAILIIFVVAAFVSLAMGTSCGTITLLTPIAVAIADSTGFNVALCVACVIGGAMFGDNLSFISDTTIAACNGQGCNMKDKFKENFKIALPAAILSIVVIAFMSINAGTGAVEIKDYNLWYIVPYLVVLIGGLIGLNVFIVLIGGIVCGSIIMLATNQMNLVHLIMNAGSGASGMFETTMVALLVTMICALIAEYGGFDAVLSFIKRKFNSKRGGMLGMGLLVGAMDVSTANNTVAIIMSNPLAKDIAETYDISPKKTASILDTFSCVFQGIIPYGAQMLIAIAMAAKAGVVLSAFEIIPHLYYPFMLLIFSLVFIFLPDRKKKAEQQ